MKSYEIYDFGYDTELCIDSYHDVTADSPIKALKSYMINKDCTEELKEILLIV